MNATKSTYLGDGVYASYEPGSGIVTLTTNSHIQEEASNVIFLEAAVTKSLALFLGKIGEECGH